MKVNIETGQVLHETEVLIRCAAHDEHIDSIIAALHRCERRIAASYDGAMYPVAPSDILYIEMVDGSTFAYGKTGCMTCHFESMSLKRCSMSTDSGAYRRAAC